MADLFRLSDAQWAVIEPHMPKNQPGPEREDDRRIISGILHVLTSGCRWRDCPSEYGPRTTVYNRFNRWSRRGFWRAMWSCPLAWCSSLRATTSAGWGRADQAASVGRLTRGSSPIGAILSRVM